MVILSERSPQKATALCGGAVRAKAVYQGVALLDESYGQPKSCRRHAHKNAFFSLLLRGGFSEQFGTTRLRHTLDSMVFHPADMLHSDAVEAPATRFFLVEIQDPVIERMRDFGARPAHAPTAFRGEALWLGARLFHHLWSGENSPLFVEGVLLELLWATQDARSHERGDNSPWMGRVVDLLHAEFAQSLTLHHIAHEANLNPAYLARRFRSVHGQSVADYVHRLRISHAMLMLATSGTTLSEIALACGFADQSHFTRVFKRLNGVTPGFFRHSLASSRAGAHPQEAFPAVLKVGEGQ